MTIECLPPITSGIGKHLRKSRAVAGFPQELTDYAPLEVISQGRSSVVYRARQKSTGQEVAVKLFHSNRITLTGERRSNGAPRFIPSHPHIACLIDRGVTTDGKSYSIFEFVPGETLRQYLRRSGALTPICAATIMAQVLDALACIHASGTVHRDIKPENILLTATGTRVNVKLIDFGIAASTVQRKQKPVAIWGTPLYCSPEQLRGEPAAPSSDLYAWGLVFAECLIGTAPVPHLCTADALGFQLGDAQVALPPAFQGHVLESLLRDVLAKDPRWRASDAVELHARLDSFLNGDGVSAGQGEAATNFPEPAQKTSPAVAIICLSMALTPCFTTPLDILAQLQEEQMKNCLLAMQRSRGELIDKIDNRLLFAFGCTDSNDALWWAADAWMKLRRDIGRRSRMLEIHHGATLDMQAALYWEGMASVGQEDTYTAVANGALRLHRSARPGEIAIDAAAEKRLLQILTPEEYHMLGASISAPAPLDLPERLR